MKTLDELHLRLDAWLIAYAGATRADIDVGTVRDARDALRELIADAEQLRAILDAAGIEVQYHEQGVTWFRP